VKKSELRQLIKEIVNTILEDPDGVTMVDPKSGRKKTTNYMQVEHVDCVVIFCNYENSPTFFAYRPADRAVYCNDTALEQQIHDRVFQKELHPVFQGSYATHSQLKVVLGKALNDPVFGAYEYDKQVRLFHARIFKWEDQFVFSCWEKLKIMKKHQSLIDQFMRDMGYTVENMRFEPGDYTETFMTYQELFGNTKIPTSRDDDVALKWREQLHLNPDLKKVVLKLPPNKLQKAADKMGMPVAQLKHLAGTFHETLNESTSADRFFWMDPNGKFFPVPPYGHEFWATQYLIKIKRYPLNQDAYEAMERLRWYRIVFTEYMGKKTLSYDHSRNRPPSTLQLRAIKDLAIELGADETKPQVF